MNDSLVNTLACSLVFVAICAEGLLLRTFLSDWRHGRSERRRRTESKRRNLGGNRLRLTAAAFASSFVLLPAHADEPAAAKGSPTPTTTDSPSGMSPAPSPAAPMTAEKDLVISTDRPSFCDTAGIVPQGHFQLETGYTFTLRNRDGVDSQVNNAPELLGRYTIIDDRLELRLSTSGYVWSRTNDGTGSQTAEGFSDVLPGLKLKLTDQSGYVPRLVLEASTTIGVGSKEISNRDVEPLFKLIWSYDLGKGWGVYGNFNVAYATTSGERFTQGQGGVCVTYAPNDKLSFYAEYFLFAPNAKGTNAAQYIDVGGAYLLTNRIQIDARVGAGLTKQSNNFLTGAGISFLF